MKELSQLARYEAEFIEVLESNHFLEPLITSICRIQYTTLSKEAQVPVSWLKAKITNMRVYATENFASFEESTTVKCQVIKIMVWLSFHLKLIYSHKTRNDLFVGEFAKCH
jgi:hypothetical protein